MPAFLVEIDRAKSLLVEAPSAMEIIQAAAATLGPITRLCVERFNGTSRPLPLLDALRIMKEAKSCGS